jgi:C4-dicarboxylate-specific signal transduction histidine kinase
MMKEGEVIFSPIDLNEVVVATLSLANSELIARQSAVEFRRGQPNVPVLGNMTQLQQVVLNLLMNAAEAMKDLPPAQRRIRCETRVLGDRRRTLSVSDNGPGVSAEAAADAFKPFVTSRPDGLGLGLSICRSIVRAHGGTLDFDPDAQGGARIVLVLPEP